MAIRLRHPRTCTAWLALTCSVQNRSLVGVMPQPAPAMPVKVPFDTALQRMFTDSVCENARQSAPAKRLRRISANDPLLSWPRRAPVVLMVFASADRPSVYGCRDDEGNPGMLQRLSRIKETPASISPGMESMAVLSITSMTAMEGCRRRATIRRSAKLGPWSKILCIWHE
jgi:hypothetical protein